MSQGVTDSERLDALISEGARVYRTSIPDRTRRWVCETDYDVKHYGLTALDAIDCLVSQKRRSMDAVRWERTQHQTRQEAKAILAQVA